MSVVVESRFQIIRSLQILDEIYDKVAHEDDQAEVIMARHKVRTN